MKLRAAVASGCCCGSSCSSHTQAWTTTAAVRTGTSIPVLLGGTRLLLRAPTQRGLGTLEAGPRAWGWRSGEKSGVAGEEEAGRDGSTVVWALLKAAGKLLTDQEQPSLTSLVITSEQLRVAPPPCPPPSR